jgi:hypothetical protein
VGLAGSINLHVTAGNKARMMLTKIENPERVARAVMQAARQVELIAQGIVDLDGAVSELADRDSPLELALVLADRVGLATSVVSAALSNQCDEPATVICRAAGLRIDTYSAVLRMRRRSHCGLAQNAALTLKAYRRLPVAAAKKLLSQVEFACCGSGH